MNALLQQGCDLILLFFLLSVLGWCIEVFLKYLQYHRLINRGFLIGPYCPIYGAGGVLITVLVRLISGVENSVGTTFVISFIGCGLLEYAVSYFMEKRFHARWWDYSQKPMNLHGRVWIGNLVLFGLGGVLVVWVVDPVLYGLFAHLAPKLRYVLTALIVVGMTADYFVSRVVMQFVKSSIERSEADNTESISNEIRFLLRNKSILYRRFADAYPEVIYRTDRINRRMQKIKEEMERIQAETAQNLDQLRQNAAYGLELIRVTPSEVQSEIIQKQDQLILCLEAGDAEPQQIQDLHAEIQKKKQVLEDRKNLYHRR